MPATARSPRRPALRRETLRIAVVFGGVSSEREVSLRSGRAVLEALRAKGHDAVPYVVETTSLEGFPSSVDAAFIALHGRFGEDGECQRLLELSGIPYTGSGPEASARALDKAWTKAILRAAGIAVPPDVSLEHPFRPRDVMAAILRAPWPKLVVKPAREGSSVGVTICETRVEAARAAWRARSFEQTILVERFVPGRELTVAILGDEALPPIEVVPSQAFYDYTAKYDPEAGTRYRVAPDDLPLAKAREVRELALAAHRALGCADVSRVDVRLDDDGTPYVLEVNTIPGLTATSLLPKAARAIGIEFPELCEGLVRRALARAGARA